MVQLCGSSSVRRIDSPPDLEGNARMAVDLERRQASRIPAVDNLAGVEFRKGGEPRAVEATLVNISMTGALLRMPEEPRRGAMLWIRLIHPAGTPAVLATAAWIGEGGKVGVAFARACNRTFLWTATHGAVSVPGRDGPGAVRNQGCA